MITVFCMNTGGHAPASEVHTLKKQVDRYLKEKHIFQCITEQEMFGVHTVKPINNLPGWWGKLNLFDLRMSHSRNLWLDLDTVITGSLDALVKPLKSQLRICKNWAKSGHGGCQSSVQYWEGNSAQIISETFDHNDAHWPPRNDLFWDNGQIAWGDQEFTTMLRDTGQIDVEYFDFPHVQSYKYHCQKGIPDDCRVVVFHGKPKPADVYDEWVMKCRE
jgi:hypothetical protein